MWFSFHIFFYSIYYFALISLKQDFTSCPGWSSANRDSSESVCLPHNKTKGACHHAWLPFEHIILSKVVENCFHKTHFCTVLN